MTTNFLTHYILLDHMAALSDSESRLNSTGHCMIDDSPNLASDDKKIKKKTHIYSLKHWHSWRLGHAKKDSLTEPIPFEAEQDINETSEKKMKHTKLKAKKTKKKHLGESDEESNLEDKTGLLDTPTLSKVDSKRISFVDSANAIEMFLPNRITLKDVKFRGILKDPEKEAELRRKREQAKSNLDRRLSLRPSPGDLLDRGILKCKLFHGPFYYQ
jgi:hypothetical protein